jgi:hypothetical protein
MSSTTLDPHQIIKRIDAIILELELLRRQLATPPPQPANLTEQLFGALGRGSWDEYEPDVEWQRFAS